jgi:hypothetical protein
MVFAKLKNFFAKLIFFPPNFFLLRKISLFQNTKKKFWREKNQLSKKGRSFFRKIPTLLILLFTSEAGFEPTHHSLVRKI